MGALRLGEYALDAAIAKLKVGMPARCAAINAEFSDEILVQPPSEDDYYLGGVTELPRAPAVIVTEGEATIEYEGTHSFMYSLSLVLFVVEQDSDRQRLARKLLRQQRAVIETLWDDPPQEALEHPLTNRRVLNLRPDRILPGRVFEPEDEGAFWRASSVVVFTATQAEN